MQHKEAGVSLSRTPAVISECRVQFESPGPGCIFGAHAGLRHVECLEDMVKSLEAGEFSQENVGTRREIKLDGAHRGV